jgi:hypothetical protein
MKFTLLVLSLLGSAQGAISFSRTITAIGPDGTFDLELDTNPPTGEILFVDFVCLLRSDELIDRCLRHH